MCRVCLWTSTRHYMEDVIELFSNHGAKELLEGHLGAAIGAYIHLWSCGCAWRQPIGSAHPTSPPPAQLCSLLTLPEPPAANLAFFTTPSRYAPRPAVAAVASQAQHPYHYNVTHTHTAHPQLQSYVYALVTSLLLSVGCQTALALPLEPCQPCACGHSTPPA